MAFTHSAHHTAHSPPSHPQHAEQQRLLPPRMKIALTPALILGLAGVVSAFPCTWNGAGSSYVYEEVSTTGNGNDCIQTIDSDHEQTTCCRCASVGDCNANEDVDSPDYGSRGCDLYAPQITVGDSAGGAALPGQWFTSRDQLERYLASTVVCKDDCVLEPSCNINVDTDAEQCGNTVVTVSSSDWCVGEGWMGWASRES
jgi:hypothetical protein